MFQLIGAISKSRHGATSSYRSVDGEAPSYFVPLLENEEDADKENTFFKGNSYRNKSAIESSDDDFDHCESHSHSRYTGKPNFQLASIDFCIFLFVSSHWKGDAEKQRQTSECC